MVSEKLKALLTRLALMGMNTFIGLTYGKDLTQGVLIFAVLTTIQAIIGELAKEYEPDIESYTISDSWLRRFLSRW